MNWTIAAERFNLLWTLHSVALAFDFQHWGHWLHWQQEAFYYGQHVATSLRVGYAMCTYSDHGKFEFDRIERIIRFSRIIRILVKHSTQCRRATCR